MSKIIGITASTPLNPKNIPGGDTTELAANVENLDQRVEGAEESIRDLYDKVNEGGSNENNVFTVTFTTNQISESSGTLFASADKTEDEIFAALNAGKRVVPTLIFDVDYEGLTRNYLKYRGVVSEWHNAETWAGRSVKFAFLIDSRYTYNASLCTVSLLMGYWSLSETPCRYEQITGSIDLSNDFDLVTSWMTGGQRIFFERDNADIFERMKAGSVNITFKFGGTIISQVQRGIILDGAVLYNTLCISEGTPVLGTLEFTPTTVGYLSTALTPLPLPQTNT